MEAAPADAAFTGRTLAALGAAGVVYTLAPWTLAGASFHWGGLAVSLRSLGNATAALLILAGASLLASGRLRRAVLNVAAIIDRLPSKNQNALTAAACLAYAAAAISHKLYAQHTLATHALDLGFFSNICWNTAFSDGAPEAWFYSSFIERNFMGVHVNWILWPLSFFYRWGGDARVLLAAQVLFTAAAFPFLLAAVRRLTGSYSAGFLACVMMACSPYIGHTVANDFHPDQWQLPCLMAALWAMLRGSRKMVLLFGALALLAKEDVSFVLAGFGIFLALKPGWRGTGAALFALAAAAFAFHTQVFIPRFLEEGVESLLFARYPLLGDSYSEMVRNIYSAPEVYWEAVIYDPLKFWRWASMWLPTAGLGFLSPSFLIPPAVSAAPHLMSQAGAQLEFRDIYSLPSQPFVFMGAAFGLRKLMRRNALAGREALLAGVCLIVAGIGVVKSPRFYRPRLASRAEAFHRMKALVPPDASVAAQQNLVPHFDARRYVQIFPIGLLLDDMTSRYRTNPAYIAADRAENSLPFSAEQRDAAIRSAETDPHYEKIFDEKDFVLLRRRVSEEPNWTAVPLKRHPTAIK
ncbi:MAG: DUF2079 domain-containing protein [Elusimicrobiota bacterium]